MLDEARLITYLKLVRANPLALECITNQTEEMCILAVERNPEAIEFVIDQTEAVCKAALCKNPLSLKYIRNKSRELIIYALKRDGMALQYIEEQDDELCTIAFFSTPSCKIYIQNFNEEFVLNIMKDIRNYQIKHYFEHLDINSEKVCEEAVSKEPMVLGFMKKQTIDFYLKLIKKHNKHDILSRIRYQSEELCYRAVNEIDGALLHDVERLYKTDKVILAAIKNNPKAITYVPSYISNKLCLQLLRIDISYIKYINVPKHNLIIIVNTLLDESIDKYNIIEYLKNENLIDLIPDLHKSEKGKSNNHNRGIIRKILDWVKRFYELL